MIQALLFHIIASILGLWFAVRFVQGVEFTGSLPLLLLLGFVLGILNAIIKPLLNLLTLPLRILTLGFSGFLLSILLVFVVDVLFNEIEFTGFLPLFLTTLLIWAASTLLSFLRGGRF